VQPLGELLAVTHRQALEFFVLGLSDVCESAVDRGELFYNASVLAHHTQVSTHTGFELPTPADLTAVFDQFVYDQTLRHDGALMEAAGTQCLLLAGFFEDQMRRRHNIHWYAGLGAGFFKRAAALARSSRKAALLTNIALHFEPWRARHARLSRELRDIPYLLMPPVQRVAGGPTS
jgi:hypothetical protein